MVFSCISEQRIAAVGEACNGPVQVYKDYVRSVLEIK